MESYPRKPWEKSHDNCKCKDDDHFNSETDGNGSHIACGGWRLPKYNDNDECDDDSDDDDSDDDYLEVCERGADSDGSLEGDGDGGVDGAHHRHVDQAEQEGDEVGEENRLGKIYSATNWVIIRQGKRQSKDKKQRLKEIFNKF